MWCGGTVLFLGGQPVTLSYGKIFLSLLDLRRISVALITRIVHKVTVGGGPTVYIDATTMILEKRTRYAYTVCGNFLIAIVFGYYIRQ